MYTIEVLDSDSFDRLPETITRGSDISDSLGFADPKTGKAYVRYTAYPDLQQYLVNHEFEELIEGHEGHEDENGIRHKKLRDTAAKAAPVIGAIGGTAIGGPLGGAVGGALGGAGGRLISSKGGRNFKSVGKSALIGGATGYAGAKLTGGFGIPGKGAALGEGVAGPASGSFLQRLGVGAKSGFGLGTALGNVKGAFSRFLGGPSAGGGAGGGGAGGGPLTALNYFIPTGTAGTPSLTGGGSGGGGGGSIVSRLFGGGGGGGLFGGGNVGSKLLGGGLLLGGMFGKKMPNVPALPQSSEAFRQFAAGGGGPLSAAARQAIQTNISDPISSEEIEASLREFRNTREQQRDARINMFKSLRPGTDPLTDTGLKREIDEFDAETARLESDFIANRARGVQSQAIAQGVGFDQNQAALLSQVAQMDIGQIMAQFNVDSQEAALIKNTLMNLGSSLITDDRDSLLEKAILAKILQS